MLATLTAPVAMGFELTKDDLKVAGYVDGGRFYLDDSTLDGEFINRVGARWSIDKEITENWTASARLHWMLWRNQATGVTAFHIAGLKFDSDMQGFLTYETGSHRIKGGVYEFKYNSDARNLGEYLLRSEAYPTIIETAQGKDLMDSAISRVAGFEYRGKYSNFRHHALLYAEQYNVPVNDISFAWLGAIGSESAEVGAGISFHRFASLGDTMNSNNLDPAMRQYIKDQGLTTRAVKLDLWGRIDFESMLGWEGNPFKLYGEVALLGLKNDTMYYKNIMQRVPIMAGLELPTFGILSSLSVEVEYFKNPYLDKKYLVRDVGGSKFSPLPDLNDYPSSSAQLPNFDKNDWKWSVWVHRSINPWLDAKIRFASDHLRLRNWNGDFETGEPLTSTPSQWYFLARIEFHN